MPGYPDFGPLGHFSKVLGSDVQQMPACGLLDKANLSSLITWMHPGSHPWWVQELDTTTLSAEGTEQTPENSRSTWYSYKKSSIARKTPFQSPFSSNSGFSKKVHRREENISYSRLTVLLGSFSLTKGKMFICAVSTAQCSGWEPDCGTQVLGTSY